MYQCSTLSLYSYMTGRLCELSLVGAATSKIFVATKLLSWQTHAVTNPCLSQQKSRLLLQQKYVCDKSFVMKNVLLEQIFASTNLLRQTFCRYKHTFVMRKVCLWRQNFCRVKPNFVATKVLLQKAYFCHDKRHFVMTNTCSSWQTCLSWQKRYLWQFLPMIVNCICGWMYFDNHYGTMVLWCNVLWCMLFVVCTWQQCIQIKKHQYPLCLLLGDNKILAILLSYKIKHLNVRMTDR